MRPHGRRLGWLHFIGLTLALSVMRRHHEAQCCAQHTRKRTSMRDNHKGQQSLYLFSKTPERESCSSKGQQSEKCTPCLKKTVPSTTTPATHTCSNVSRPCVPHTRPQDTYSENACVYTSLNECAAICPEFFGLTSPPLLLFVIREEVHPPRGNQVQHTVHLTVLPLGHVLPTIDSHPARREGTKRNTVSESGRDTVR